MQKEAVLLIVSTKILYWYFDGCKYNVNHTYLTFCYILVFILLSAHKLSSRN